MKRNDKQADADGPTFLRSLGGRLSLLLLGAIVLPTMVISLWFVAELKREYEARIDNAIADTESDLQSAFNTFDLLMAEEERDLDRRMRERLPIIAKRLKAMSLPYEKIPVETLDRMAKENGFDHLYIIDRDTKVINTNFAPDQGFTLGDISSEIRSFLTNLVGVGDVVVDRINASAKTGVLKKYAYYGPVGDEYLFEVSVDLKDYLTRVRSAEYTHFLFNDIFGEVVERHGVTQSVGIFIVNDISFFPFLDYATPFDPTIAARLPAEKVVRVEQGERLHVYKLIHLKGGRLSGAEYVAVRMVFDLREIGAFTRNVHLMALLVVLVAAFISLLVSALLFRRLVVDRVGRINRSLELIGVGDYRHGVSDAGADELSEVARKIDAMRTRLIQRDQELTALNVTLEERIGARTAELHMANVELRSARDEAESATRLKDKFLSLVAHDLQSPLHGVRGMLDILRGESLTRIDDGERAEIYHMMVGSVDALIHLIRTLLDVSRFQSGEIKLKKRFVDAHDIVERSMAAIRPRAEEKGITLVNTLPVGIRLLADPEMLVGVLGNLFSNAVKFTPRNGRVDVFNPPGEWATIAVSDSGPGIAPEMMEHLFRHDVKTVGVGSEGEVGTGLGLPYSADIMKAHFGTLSVESQLGVGATFYANLPPVRVVAMVVDDQDAHRAMMRDALTDLPHLGFVECVDGQDAAESVGRIVPDLLITDLCMDAVDGYALIEGLRKLEPLKTIPILVVTSLIAEGNDAKEQVKERLAPFGVDGLIAKPIQKDSFGASVKELLASSGLLSAARGEPDEIDIPRTPPLG